MSHDDRIGTTRDEGEGVCRFTRHTRYESIVNKIRGSYSTSGTGMPFEGKVTDEIIADLDIYPTIANLVGEEARIPTDRPIDGINQAAFFLGEQEKSDREYAVTYVGDTVFAVKWRNMKVHFATFEGTHSILHKYTFPQVFDIKEDMKESYELWGNEGYAHAWVMSPVSKILTGLAVSMQKYPNIKPGDQDFKGYK